MTNDLNQKSLELHRELRGKIEVSLKSEFKDRDDLALLYTPGVGAVSSEVAKNPKLTNVYTNRGNTVAIVTDGSAVLGLGNIGPEGGLPVMEGKSLLFKEFGGVDAYPILLKTQDTEEIIQTVLNISPTFAGINLEDISAPRCFEIEKRLIEALDIPVFHDDQHGTAIVVLAGLINALKLAEKKIENVKIVINGAGAAGIAIHDLLVRYGVKNICMLDSKGVICDVRSDLTKAKRTVLNASNCPCGDLEEIMKDADVFIGVSKGNLVTPKMVESMAVGPIIFAMANPIPEISYEEAKKAGAFVAATGRSDTPNQINNALVFPGLFRGLLDNGVKKVTIELKLKVAEALANHVTNPNPENIIPDVMDKSAHKAVAEAVASSTISN